MIGKSAAVMAATMMIGAPLNAQSIGPFAQDASRLDARATIGITVPLGGRRDDIASRPRAELRLGQGGTPSILTERIALPASGIAYNDTLAPVPGALAVTLGGDPRWMAGGRILGADQDETPEDDDGIDTLEGIGIGVGVVLVLAAAAAATLAIQLDCDRDCS